jgi:hypothetical protein
MSFLKQLERLTGISLKESSGNIIVAAMGVQA